MKHCYNNILAIDPSLRSSGWALFSFSNQKLLDVGKVCSLNSSQHNFQVRIQDLHNKISSLFDTLNLGARDVLVLESATTIKDPASTLKVEQVRSIFETIARSRGVNIFGRLNPRTVQSEVLGLRGRQIKREEVKLIAKEMALRMFKEELEEIQSPFVNIKKS